MRVICQNPLFEFRLLGCHLTARSYIQGVVCDGSDAALMVALMALMTLMTTLMALMTALMALMTALTALMTALVAALMALVAALTAMMTTLMALVAALMAALMALMAARLTADPSPASSTHTHPSSKQECACKPSFSRGCTADAAAPNTRRCPLHGDAFVHTHAARCGASSRRSPSHLLMTCTHARS